jgi:hypothetical protein
VSNKTWFRPDEKLPTLYRTVITDEYERTQLTPDGWDCGAPPQQWAYPVTDCYVEDQLSINEWQDETFGEGKNPAGGVGRMLEEIIELVALLVPRNDAAQFGLEVKRVCEILYNRPLSAHTGQVANESADVGIVLKRVAQLYGFDQRGAEDFKMEINRNRKWSKRGDGHGKHIDG